MKKLCMIEQFGKNDVAYWCVEISNADKAAIDKILAKYETDGISSRGTVDVLDELKPLYGASK